MGLGRQSIMMVCGESGLEPRPRRIRINSGPSVSRRSSRGSGARVQGACCVVDDLVDATGPSQRAKARTASLRWIELRPMADSKSFSGTRGGTVGQGASVERRQAAADFHDNAAAHGWSADRWPGPQECAAAGCADHPAHAKGLESLVVDGHVPHHHCTMHEPHTAHRRVRCR